MKLREYREGDLERVHDAIAKLRQARELLVEAGAGLAAAKVRRAIKSAEGAERHTARLKSHAENPGLIGGSGG
jgi:hypothetical protein